MQDRIQLARWAIVLVVLVAARSNGQSPESSLHPLQHGGFRWQVSDPVLQISDDKLPQVKAHPWIAVKDPSVIRHDGRWHLFCTLRRAKDGDGRIRIGSLSFTDWAAAKEATWNVLDLTPGYHGAPQVFYFRPHRKWYLIYQAEDQRRGLRYGPCFSTNDDLLAADQWTLPKPIYVVPEGTKAGLDFWIICDETKAHLFFTSLNGKMWRAETLIENFPNKGWLVPSVVLKADIFEASHTYSLKGQQGYVTVVEAQANQRRYFKAFIAERLDGKWAPLASSRQKPLVSPVNVTNQEFSWATSYSHGEFIRTGFDERLEIDPGNLQILFQGASDQDYQNKVYGQIPWRLGLLKPAW